MEKLKIFIINPQPSSAVALEKFFSEHLKEKVEAEKFSKNSKAFLRIEKIMCDFEHVVIVADLGDNYEILSLITAIQRLNEKEKISVIVTSRGGVQKSKRIVKSGVIAHIPMPLKSEAAWNEISRALPC